MSQDMTRKNYHYNAKDIFWFSLIILCQGSKTADNINVILRKNLLEIYF